MLRKSEPTAKMSLIYCKYILYKHSERTHTFLLHDAVFGENCSHKHTHASGMHMGTNPQIDRG